MSITSCRKCGEKMSDKFTSCPKCGANQKLLTLEWLFKKDSKIKIDEKQQKLGYLVLEILMILFFTISVFLSADDLIGIGAGISGLAILAFFWAKKIGQEKTKYFDIANIAIAVLTMLTAWVGIVGVILCIINIVKRNK